MFSIRQRQARGAVALLVCGGLLLSCGSPEGEPTEPTEPTEATDGDPGPASATGPVPAPTSGGATTTGDGSASAPPPPPSTDDAPTSAEPTDAAPADPRPERCRGLSEAEVQEKVDRLGADIEEAMAGYESDWSFGLVDLDCDVELALNEDWVAYPASAGKIVPIIAALRAVEDGDLELADFETNLLGVMEHSWDADANVINDLVTPEQVQEVLELAEVSEATSFEHRWGRADMPAIDLARVWEALLDGRLLGEEQADYLLDLAEGPQIPPGLDTFPVDPEMPGWQFGQKAGYWVSSGVPYFLLGAGYLRPSERTEDEQGLAIVLHLRSTDPDLYEPQRREVFPLIREYALRD